MSSLTELREKVERATGPDRELDAQIAAMFRIHWTSADHWINRTPELEFRPLSGAQNDRAGWLELWMPDEPTPRNKWKADKYTASIDAALALVKAKLPGRWNEILRKALSSMSLKHAWHITFCRADQLAELPREIIASLLRSLESQEQAGG